MALITLPDLPRRLAEISKDGTGPSYGQIYRAALSGLIPVVKIGSRYFGEDMKLPEIAGYFHIALKASTKPARSQRSREARTAA